MKKITKETREEEMKLLPYFDKYYRYLFPWQDFYKWFSYGDAARFPKREFAFRILVTNSFMRTESFENDKQLATFVRQRRPKNIDAGAYFAARPNTINFMTVGCNETTEKELVFDIDASDYDDVRTCCKEKNLCQKCWSFIAVGCKILDALLREDYGWKLILWVFSGRRGVHCWVCDESARKMSDEQREQFVKVVNLGLRRNGRDNMLRSKHLSNHIRRSFEFTKKEFLRVCVEEQDILGTDEGVKTFVSRLPDVCREKIRRMLLEVSPGKFRWIRFHKYWARQKSAESVVWQERPHLLEEVIFRYLYPRIDENVTISMNHLLKVPYSVHPSTRLIAIPFDPRHVDEFCLDEIPDVTDLADIAMDIARGKSPTGVNEQFQVSYESSMRVFKTFVKLVEEVSALRSADL